MRDLNNRVGVRGQDRGADEWVVYRPPKSVSFGQASRIRDPRRAWPMVERFLGELTQSVLQDRIELFCNLAAPFQPVVTDRSPEARQLFGPEKDAPAVGQGAPNWAIGQAELASAIQFALDDDRFSKQKVGGPTTLMFHYQFCWTEFSSGTLAVAGAEAVRRISTLGVILGGGRLFLQSHFIFPAPCHSERLKDFIDRNEELFPIRINDNYFRRWLPSQSSNGPGRFLKMAPNWRRGSILQ